MKDAARKSKKLIALEKILKFFSRRALKKYRPRIIGITGSVGKTSAKEAIFAVLSSKFDVRKNEKNYNNEIGIPLTILGVESGEDSFWNWLFVILKSFWIVIFPVKYPQILVLEMGADRPGDIRYLSSFIDCEMSVITDISGSHLEYFGTIEKVAEEKWTLVKKLKKELVAAVNADNPIIEKSVDEDKEKGRDFLTFGFSEKADIRAEGVFFNYSPEEELRGISFKLNYKGTTMPFRLKNILATHLIYAAMAGVAAGINFKMNLVEIASALENFSVLPGRMKLIKGLGGSLIIDDTYNSSPVSALAALDVIKNIKTARKIAVMGDMLELGNLMEEGHRKVGEKFYDIEAGMFFAVGKRMRFAAKALERLQIAKDRLFIFENPEKAGEKLRKIIKKGDLILVKGSQGMRMEKVVEKIMAEPERAAELLCRQDEKWKRKEWREV